jgi:hypothetical protein
MKILAKILACGGLALGVFAVPLIAADATGSFGDPGAVRCQVCGAQYRVSHTPIGSRTHSEFILCDGFAFRPSNVDGYSDQAYADGSAVTIVNFKSYTQTIPDSERRLFDFLIRKLKPKPANEGD